MILQKSDQNQKNTLQYSTCKVSNFNRLNMLNDILRNPGTRKVSQYSFVVPCPFYNFLCFGMGIAVEFGLAVAWTTRM